MDIYTGMLIAVIAIGFLANGAKPQNKKYIIFMGLILFGFCALRGIRVGADLGRYQTHYTNCYEVDWQGVFKEYQLENIGFYYICKLHSFAFGYDFKNFIMILAIFEGVSLIYVIYKLSVNPYMSYMIYISMGYYIFIYSGLKQALATVFIMFAFIAVIEKKPIRFLLFVSIATLIHMPAMVFCFAYTIGNRQFRKNDWIVWIIAAIAIFIFKENIVILMTDVYDSVVETNVLGGVGGKVIMMIAFIVVGALLRYPDGENRTYLASFNLMIVAAMLQIFAVYGNVFERLADYYFVFSMLYLPMVFQHEEQREGSVKGYIMYDPRIYNWIEIVIVIFSIMYYYQLVHSTPGILPYTFSWKG